MAVLAPVPSAVPMMLPRWSAYCQFLVPVPAPSYSPGIPYHRIRTYDHQPMTTKLNAAPLSIGEIAQRIQLIRGQRVVLHTDLAAFYGETTKRFNQQVNRNLNRFSPGFMFQLSEQEFANLKLQFATSSLKGGHGGRRYAPLAFIEHGAIMASMVLNSPRATELSVYVGPQSRRVTALVNGEEVFY